MGKPVQQGNEKVALSLPIAPRFSVFSKNDAVWSNRINKGNSLRQLRHMVNATALRASESQTDNVKIFKKGEINALEEQKVADFVDPMEKVRNFLDMQIGLAAITEDEIKKNKRPSNQSVTKKKQQAHLSGQQSALSAADLNSKKKENAIRSSVEIVRRYKKTLLEEEAENGMSEELSPRSIKQPDLTSIVSSLDVIPLESSGGGGHDFARPSTQA